MNILKRPMFYAATVCCVAAALSLFVKLYAFVFLITAIIVFFALDYYNKNKYIFILFILILFLISLCFHFFKVYKIDNHNGESLTGKFLICSDVIEYDDFNIITIKPKNNKIIPNGIKLLLFDYEKSELEIGDIVEAELKISSIDKNDKYRLSNYSSGVYATANTKKLEKVDTNAYYKAIGSIRSYVNTTLSKRFDEDTAGLLCAITTGDKTLISDDLSHNVKTTGISHVVVVSGMHLSIIMSAVFFVLDKLFYNKYLRCILSIVIIVIIAAVCGFTMSIIRAGTMFVIMSFAPVFNRENDYLNSLLAAVTFILVVSPFTIFNVSFLLSVLSTLAIVWMVPFYSNWIFDKLKLNSKIIKTIVQMIMCCLFPNIFTLPVSIKLFGYVSIVSPLTNMCITYFVTFALILNIVAMALRTIPVISFLGELCLTLAGYCAKFIVFVVNKIAALPITVAVLPKSAFWVSIIVLFAIIGLMYYINIKHKKKEVIRCQ